MPKLIILGTSNAIPDERHDNTHLALVGEKRVVLVDCVNNPTVRLRQAGLEMNSLTDLVLTHFHPDHVSGVPSLLMNSWLLGRRQALEIYGLRHTLERLVGLMDYYEWTEWPGFYPVNFHYLPEEDLTPVLQSEEFSIFASPVRHLIPTIGLRIEFAQDDQVLAYSCDTEPCPAVIQLASGANVLIHEATGASLGHSSAAQAGAVAREAEVGKLYLIHYPTGRFYNRLLASEASQTFSGPVILTEDLMELNF